MSKPDIIFHVGLPKTGTTSIQHFFKKHYDACLKRGLLYPKAGSSNRGLAHHPWHRAFSPEERPVVEDWIEVTDRNELLDNLGREIATRRPRKLLFSSEAFRPKSVSAMLNDIPHNKATIVLFLRRADHLLEAQYAQGIKTGRHKMTAQAFFEMIERKPPEWLRPYELLSSYASLPADFKLKPFERQQIRGPLAHCFLEMLDEPELCHLDSEQEENKRPHPLVTQLLQSRTGEERLLGPKYNALRKVLNAIALERDSTPANSFFSPEQRLSVLAAAADDYHRIAEELMGIPGDTLFVEPQPRADTSWERPATPTLTDSVDLMLALWDFTWENNGGHRQ